MQFFKSVSLLALAAQAFAGLSQYQFFAKTGNKELDGHGLYYIHEGAAINYYFLANNTETSSASVVTYNDETQEFYYQVNPQIRFVLTVSGGILQLSAGEPLKTSIGDDGIISFNGSELLSVVKSIDDPYGYSKENFAVTVKDDHGGIPISIEARKYESS
ncbi:hypothetical protein FOB58_002242 [Candida parapsilosis]|uniref:Hyphally-regulated cell wall protein N-terminal domain-containing protein n=2 Tax=Candida parapsilosis TaxID=5480 RepID=G8BB64_CANPC|nr:uncharacterized protein CPAR2_808370 [Candida parapsilosis]KAF6052182.1 hypothetical protein FOB58_002242 [Candida parapsilosis]KAF6052321.1 hypothetical protein FOB60_002577 [Candida parapsilosis]KAF6053984.1 hypothetical protein FOB59_002266 [Candida parapsilosis]KAF6064097.1 hypothetical protein FOB61_002523 [Candida parapsilosis]KAI5902645.1 Cell wall protein PGA31 [Candida parapsilosis]